MPRPPTHRHILRDLRGVIQLSQAALAEMIGVSAVAVNRIENGMGLKLTEPVAVRVYLTTGANIAELMRGKDGRLVDDAGRNYTSETFKRWRSRRLRVSEDEAGSDAANLQWWIEQLLRAAAGKRGGRSYHAVKASIVQAVAAACEVHKLGADVERVLAEHSPRVAWCPGAFTPDYLRAVEAERVEAENEPARDEEWKRQRTAELIAAAPTAEKMPVASAAEVRDFRERMKRKAAPMPAAKQPSARSSSRPRRKA